MSVSFGRTRRQRGDTLFGNILGIFIGVGAALGMQFTIMQTASETESWPSVQGTVLESRVEESRDNDGERMYSAYVRYRYEVNGEPYTSDQINIFQGSTGSRRPAQNTVNEYRVESPVEVFYNPDAPADALLQVGATTLLKWLYRGAWILAALCASAASGKVFRLLRAFIG